MQQYVPGGSPAADAGLLTSATLSERRAAERPGVSPVTFLMIQAPCCPAGELGEAVVERAAAQGLAVADDGGQLVLLFLGQLHVSTLDLYYMLPAKQKETRRRNQPAVRQD